MGKKIIRLGNLRLDINSDTNAGKVIEYIKKERGNNYSEVVAEIILARYLPLVLEPGSQRFRAIAISSACECQRQSEAIAAYAGLPQQIYKHRYRNESIASVESNSTEVAPKSIEEGVNLIVDRIEKYKYVTIRRAAIDTLLGYYLPLAIAGDDTNFDAIAIKSVAACLSWANEIREHAGLALVDRVATSVGQTPIMMPTQMPSPNIVNMVEPAPLLETTVESKVVESEGDEDENKESEEPVLTKEKKRWLERQEENRKRREMLSAPDPLTKGLFSNPDALRTKGYGKDD